MMLESTDFLRAATGGGGAVWEQQTMVIEVPNDKVGLLIGKAGSAIKELEQRSGARVKITPVSKWQGRSEPRPIQLTGTQQQLVWCKGLISKKVKVPVEQLASTQTFDVGAPVGQGWGGGAGGIIVNVPNESVGRVIGKQGSTIKQLQQQSGARIHIAKDCPAGSNMRPITVSGPPASVEQAKSLILQKASGVMPFFCFTPV